MKHSTIAIIGAGRVGTTTAYALMLKDLAGEILLVDIDPTRCKGEILDLSDSLSFSVTSKIREATPKEAAQADIIIITAGIAQKPGQSRRELLAKNKKVMDSIAQSLQPINPKAIILMITNPVDLMTRYMQEKIGLPRNQVFGSGTFLDSQRLHELISKKIGVAEQSIHAYILGEHGDSQLVAWSSALVAGIPILDFPEVSEKDLALIAEQAKKKVYEIIACKGATFYGIASCAASICESIIFDQKRVIPLSCYNKEFETCLSMPTIVGEQGIEKILAISLTDNEKEALKKSANALLNQYQEAT